MGNSDVSCNYLVGLHVDCLDEFRILYRTVIVFTGAFVIIFVYHSCHGYHCVTKFTFKVLFSFLNIPPSFDSLSLYFLLATTLLFS